MTIVFTINSDLPSFYFLCCILVTALAGVWKTVAKFYTVTIQGQVNAHHVLVRRKFYSLISRWHCNLSEMNYLTISILNTSEKEDNALKTYFCPFIKMNNNINCADTINSFENSILK